MGDHRPHRVALAMLACALAILAGVAGEPAPARPGQIGRERSRAIDVVSALELAHRIREGKAPLRIVDLRERAAFDEHHLPGAQHVSHWMARSEGIEPGATIVLYANGASTDGEAVDRARRLIDDAGAAPVFLLDGGVLAWITQVESPRLAPLPVAASRADSLARLEHVALSRWFGGTPVVDPALAADSGATGPRSGAGGTSASGDTRANEAVRAVRRRGC